MSVSDAYVEVECDGCYEIEIVTLTPIACRGWDERNVNDHMESMGWLVDGDKHYCEECKKAVDSVEKK